MVNLQPQSTTERNSHILLDEEDERERVLLVGVVSGPDQIAPYALSVKHVREVLRNRQTTRVPGTPNVMRGLVNVRGMVVTILDLATCLGHSTPPAPAYAEAVTGPRAQTTGSIVLLEHGSRLIGLAVDDVREVRPLDDGAVVGESRTDGERRGFVRGLVSAGGEVVTLLDVAALISRHLISGES
ncbi:MAG: chemotaxis protein CheW [Phycisphaerae bacterium]|nr:chemotaxis protein CheW [Gemmatimonadaceae bacterium]